MDDSCGKINESNIEQSKTVWDSDGCKIKPLQAEADKPRCWSCKTKYAKYKCPQCFIRTCSLECVKHHKKVQQCNGTRIKTNYVAMSEYNEANLFNDYRFLEEVYRCASQAESVKTTCLKGGKQFQHPKFMNIHVNKASQMGIKLKHLPKTFSRRKLNTTFYNFGLKQFLWHVEWVFLNGEVTFHDKMLDNVPLKTSVRKFTSSKDGEKFDPRLFEYSDADDVKFFVKNEFVPANNISEKYSLLNGELGLRENLRGKTVVEFPQIHIVLSPDVAQYQPSDVV